MVALRLTLCLFCLATPALAAGRADWTGYAWQKIEIADCIGTDPGNLACPPYRQKWDWKRNQWVNIVVTLDIARNTLRLTQRLINNDRSDRDYVCVTAILTDEAGRTLIAHHQNWQIGPGDILKQNFAYRSSALATARTIHIGSKQCRDGATQDDDIYADVLDGLKP